MTFSSIRALYAHYGIDLHEESVTTPALFVEMLKKIESHVSTLNCRVMPSSFDPADPHMCAVPSSPSFVWTSLIRALQETDSHGVMTRLPLFWQTEVPLHRACRSAGAFIYVNDRANMPLGALALTDGEIDAIVTEWDDAGIFSLYLSENNFPLQKVWIIVESPHTGGDTLPLLLLGEDVRAYREVHLFPGVPVLEQCSALAQERGNRFHVCESYAVEKTADSILLTEKDDTHPFPLFRYAYPTPLPSNGQCLCGRDVFIAEKNHA